MKSHETKRHWTVKDGTVQHKIGHVIIDALSMPFEEQNHMLADLLNKAYQLGRQDEFSDNCRRGEKLMKEFGI